MSHVLDTKYTLHAGTGEIILGYPVDSLILRACCAR